MTIDDAKAMELALKRAESWFSIHADQRLKLLNFYIVLLAAIVAGSLTTFEKKLYFPLLALALLAILLTYCFQQLDQRTRQLIKSAEVALNEIEKVVSSQLSKDEFLLVHKADQKNGIPSYRQTFMKIFVGAYTLGLGSALYALYQLISCKI